MIKILEGEEIRFHLLASVIIISVGLLIYSNSLHSSFHFDDYRNIVDNPSLKCSSIPELLHKNLLTLDRGLVRVTFAFNYYLGGLAVEGYHWVNISIHLINGLLVYYLMGLTLCLHLSSSNSSPIRPLSASERRKVHTLALFTALFFVASPIQTQAVTYIVQRYEAVAALFYLLSILLFAKAVSSQGVRVPLYVGSILCLSCALWSKEIAYTAPAMLFLYYQCFISKDWKGWPRGLKLLLPYLLLAAVFFNYREAQRGVDTEIFLGTEMPLAKGGTAQNRWEYILTQANVTVEYIRLMLWPSPGRLNIDYDFPVVTSLWERYTVVSLAAIVLCLCTSALLLHRASLVAFCILWFFIILSPRGLVPLLDIIVLHRLYLPGLAFYLLVVIGIHRGFGYLSSKMGQEITPGRVWLIELMVFTAITVSYGAGTYERNKVWQTGVTLWEDAVKKSPGKIRTHYNLAQAYRRGGLIDEAEKEYTYCIAILVARPQTKSITEREAYGRACNNLGNIYIEKGRYELAISILEEALRVGIPRAHHNLGIAYALSGRLEEAETEFRLAIQAEPEYSSTHHWLGVVYEKKGMLDEAVLALETALKADPKNSEAHARLGLLLSKHSRDLVKALFHLREALKLGVDENTRKVIIDAIKTIQDKTPSEP